MASTTSAMDSPPSSKSLALRPCPDLQPDTIMTDLPGLCIFDLPLELRWEIYTYYLIDVLQTHPQEVRIEARRHRGKTDFRRAMDSVTLKVPTAILLASRMVNSEVTDLPKHELVAPRVKFIVEVKDMDFRLLGKFVKWVGSKDNRFASLTDFSLRKVVAGLKFTRALNIDGQMLGRWLVERSRSGIPVEYRVEEMERPVETMHSVLRVAWWSSEELDSLGSSVIGWTRAVHVAARQLAGDSECVAKERFRLAMVRYGEGIGIDSDGLWMLEGVDLVGRRPWYMNLVHRR
ncbi:hypothetical protein LTR17_013914 [Elasticomyces elasticus]|nr:hypothetical protein LTR17_013914 [Elasticomyces elasticus]